MNHNYSMKNFVLILFTVLGTLEARSQSPCLVANYPFNGNAMDATGNGHDGTVYGATLAEDRNGTPNAAYYFDGTDDFIKLAGTWGGSNGTITAWIRPDVLNQFNPIFSRRDTTMNGSALELVVNVNYQPDSSKLYKGVDLRDCGEGLYFRNSNIEIQPLVWTCVAMSADDLETKLFVDGMQVGSYGGQDPGFWFADMCPNNINTYIGMLTRPANTEHFIGYIDDVRVYDCALDANEITTLCDINTAITSNRPQSQVSIFPNPTTGIVHIITESANFINTPSVFDAQGRQMLVRSTKLPGTGTFSIDLSDLLNGSYMIRCGGYVRSVLKMD